MLLYCRYLSLLVTTNIIDFDVIFVFSLANDIKPWYAHVLTHIAIGIGRREYEEVIFSHTSYYIPTYEYYKIPISKMPLSWLY